ncbi:MAG: aspartate aminotransferase family protein [Acidimicrobiia bacterium]|nr:aspartate aminotransferase family protein [Acidimicrobiia bacterium]
MPSDRDHLIHRDFSLMAQARHQLYDEPLVLARGSMEYLYDTDGNEYLDCFSGIMVTSCGHANPEINARIKAQVDLLLHTSTFYLTEPLLDLVARLEEITPAGLSRSFLVNSGSEAVDGAILLAREHTGNEVVVSLQLGYHGRTLLTEACTNVSGADDIPFGPDDLGVAVGCNAYCYRCPLGLEYPGCGVGCADSIDTELDAAGIDRVAAIVVEPIQGVGGVIVSPPGHLESLERIAHARDGVLIIDEVQSGFGRTGTMFVSEQYDISPDILVMGKAMANGVPAAAYVARDDIGEAIQRPTFSTYGGNPLASAAALATIDYIIDNDLPARAARAGQRFEAGLADLAGGTDLIGEIRGRGLFLGVELVRDPATKEPAGDQGLRLVQQCRERGLIVGKSGPHGNVIRIGPALTISDSQIDRALEVLDASLRTVEIAS